jgi:uncharacterized membrane protein
MKQSPLQTQKIDALSAPIQQPALIFFVAGLVGLGILALIYGDFALVWQPVPAGLPGRTALAYASGVLMLVCGAGLLFKSTAESSARILFPYLILWALLKVPALFVAPQIEGVWLGFGELAMLLAGGWMLFARMAGISKGSKLAFATGDSGIRIARYLFAVWIIPVGLSHFFYLKATVALVPAWLPFKAGWAWFTGAGHIACGLAILFGVIPRIAALAEAAMIGIFTLLVWGPKIIVTPHARLPWTAFFISWIIAAAAGVVACNLPVSRSAEPVANRAEAQPSVL